jgi:hypothetical protein
MKIIYAFVVSALLLCGVEVPDFSASTETTQGTWVGEISAGSCGIVHHQGMTASDCTHACIADGAKFVLVSGGDVYTFANQADKKLDELAGETVKVTGELKGRTLNSVTIEKVAAEERQEP